MKKHSVQVINNGIDLEIFKPTYGKIKEKYNLEDKKIILGVANIWDERKGLKFFIQLASKLTLNYQIVLVGVSEKQINKFPSNIIGIKRTKNLNELAKIYTIADVFLNPTLEDNFPTVNLEALACGTPIITYSTGGSVELRCINNAKLFDKKNIYHLYIEKYMTLLD